MSDQHPEGFGPHNPDFSGPEPHVQRRPNEDERKLGYPTERGGGKFDEEPELEDLQYPFEDEDGRVVTPEAAVPTQVEPDDLDEEDGPPPETDADLVGPTVPDFMLEIDEDDELDAEAGAPVEGETPDAALARVEA